MKKFLLPLFVFVVVIVLSLWVYDRWGVWFGRNPEPAFVIKESISCVQLSVGDAPLSQRFVSWRSCPDSALLDSGAVRLVWFNSTDTVFPEVHSKLISSEGGSAIYFWSEVSSLGRGTYQYLISAPDTLSEVYTTEISYDSVAYVMVIGDVQDKRYTGTDTLLRQAVDSFQPDFLFQLGDLIERPHQHYWNRYFADFDSVCTSIPMAVVVGNHDYHKGVNKYPDERLFFTFPYYLNEYNDAPTIGCSVLDFGATCFYLLDTNQPLWRLHSERVWLRNCLAQSMVDKEHIVLMHHPLRSAESRFNNLIVRWMFEPLIREYGVSLVLAGHEHTYHALSPEQTGGYTQIISHFSAKEYAEAEGVSGRHPLLFRIALR